MASETILIIDDNADVRILLGERVLPSYGYRTLVAPDGQEGLWQIRTNNPDLILLDLRLPDMTGLDLLHVLSSEGYDTPVILITAYGSELIAAQALRLGVHDYIIKPFTLDEIIESVERALTEQRLRRERNALVDRLQYCTTAMRMLTELGTEFDHTGDPQLRLCRLLSAAVAATRSQAGRLWFLDALEGTLQLYAIQERADQPAYVSHQPQEAPPQVEEALAAGTLQQWTKEETGDEETGLAVPILMEGKPQGVLEVDIADQEEVLENGTCQLILQSFAERLGLAQDCSRLRRQGSFLQRQIEVLGSLSADVLLVLDAQETIVAATSAIEALTGQPAGEVIGRDFRQWIEEIESPQGELVEWYLRQLGQEHTSERYAFAFSGPQGEQRHAEVQVLSHQEEGASWRYLLFHDTTTSDTLEQNLRTLRRTLSEVIRGSRLGLFLTDLQGTVLAVNSILSESLGLPQEALVGRSIWEAFADAEGGNRLPEEIARAYREGSGYTEVHWLEKDDAFWGVASLLLLGAEGTPYGIAVLTGPAYSASTAPEATT